MAYAGLLLVIGGWIYQFASKGNDIKAGFVLAYAAGVVLLVIDGFQNDMTTLAALNLISLVSAVAVLFKILK
jgi:hypothetical protein